MMSQLKLTPARIETIMPRQGNDLPIDVLRLDEIDPVVSGNKWYKLKEYLGDALSQSKKIIVTFGGAYSNHIIATAAACRKMELQSMGIIRGEKPAVLSHTLQHAEAYRMKLFFISREDYRQKRIPEELYLEAKAKDLYIIDEGGYGIKGAEGAAALLENVDATYSHIIAAVGTGTTLAGLVRASHENQTIIGIPVLKNNFSLQKEVEDLLPNEKRNFILLPKFHFGGYAKYDEALIAFMNDWYRRTGIPCDFVYTGKLFFAVDYLVQQNYFPAGSKILVVHSGGLQGNESLPKGTLIF